MGLYIAGVFTLPYHTHNIDRSPLFSATAVTSCVSRGADWRTSASGTASPTITEWTTLRVSWPGIWPWVRWRRTTPRGPRGTCARERQDACHGYTKHHSWRKYKERLNINMNAKRTLHLRSDWNRGGTSCIFLKLLPSLRSSIYTMNIINTINSIPLNIAFSKW